MQYLVDKCCDPKCENDDWDLILKISEIYANQEPKKCARNISRKVFQRNASISLKAITLLDFCAQNAGNAFLQAMSSRKFVVAVHESYSRLAEAPRMKLLESLEKWSEVYASSPHLSLLSSLFPWVQKKYPSDICALEANRRSKHEKVVKNIRENEEEDIAKAISLSLTYTGEPSSTPKTQQDSAVSDSVALKPVLLPGPSDLGKIRALFDFEAVEDNELTLRSGEVFTLLDNSDPHWWRGTSQRGEGLFPAQFVEKYEEKSKETESENILPSIANESKLEERAIQIDPQLLENCLQMLLDVDPTGLSRLDPPELPQMEAKCREMEPLIDRELIAVDARIVEVENVKQCVVDAMLEFNSLISQVGPPQNSYGKPVRLGDVLRPVADNRPVYPQLLIASNGLHKSPSVPVGLGEEQSRLHHILGKKISTGQIEGLYLFPTPGLATTATAMYAEARRGLPHQLDQATVDEDAQVTQ